MTEAQGSAPADDATAALAEAVCVIDGSGRVVGASPMFRRLFRMAATDAAPELGEVLAAAGARIESVGNLDDLRPEIEAKITLQEGTSLGLTTRPMPPIGTMISVSVIEGHKALTIDRSLMATVLQALPTTISVKDHDGRYILVNPAWERIHGIRASDALGRRFDEIHMKSTDPLLQREQQGDVVDRDMFVLRNNVALHGMEEVFIRTDGRRVTLLSQKVPLAGADGRAVGIVSVTTDITDLKEAQSELQAARERAEAALAELKAAQGQLLQAEKLASLGELLAGLAHEVNTPLGVALGAMSHIENRVSGLHTNFEAGELTSDEFKAALDELAQSGSLARRTLERAVGLIGALKRVSVDRAAGERRRFQIDAYIADVASTLKSIYRGGGHKLELNLTDKREMDSFPGPFAQIITNFVNNAVLHGFDGRNGGIMTLTSAVVDERETELRFTDNGGGIPPDVLPRIFEPFFTTARSRGGSGIGLHLVYDLVTKTFGGSIDVESALGVGTAFTLRLPLQAPVPVQRARDEELAA